MNTVRLCCFWVVVIGLGIAFGLGYADEDNGVIRPPVSDFAGGVQGRVTTASGRPLEGAVVSAILVDSQVPLPVPIPVPEPMPPMPVPGTGEKGVADPNMPAPSMAQGMQGMQNAAGQVKEDGTAPGRIVDADGKVREIGPDGVPVQRFQARTDREGRFLMKLPLGRYLLQVSAPGFRTVFYEDASVRSAATVVAVDGRHAVAVTVALQPMSTLSGQVTDAKTGAPVSAGGVVAERLNSREGFRRQVELSRDGVYLIEGLEPGVYRVRALALGYLTAFYTGGERSGLVEVAEGSEVVGIDIAVSEGLAISGRVTTAEGQPLAGAALVASPLVGEGRTQVGASGEDGGYRVSGLAPGTYLVTAGKPGYGRVFFGNVKVRDRATPVPVTLDEQPTDVDFQLMPVGSLIGRVTARTGGEAVAGAIVTATPRGGERRWQAQTDASGGYLISDLPTADYVVHVQAEGYVPQFYTGALEAGAAQPVRVLSDAHTVGIDFLLGRLSVISGKVMDRDGQAVAGARIVLMRDAAVEGQTGRMPPEPSFSRVMRYAETGQDGRYRIEVVPPGVYVLQATAGGFTPGFFAGEEPAGPQKISVGVEQEISGMDVVLPRLGVISGRISTSDGGTLEEVEVVAEWIPPEVAAPVAGQTGGRDASSAGSRADGNVDAIPPPSSDMPMDQRFPTKAFRGEIVDAGEGIYRIVGLPEGRFIIHARARGYVVVWYDGADKASAAEQMQVEMDQEVTGVDFALTRGGVISGYVLADGTGAPVPLAVVSAQRLEGSGIWRAKAGRNGAYELNGLPGGRYLVSVQAEGFVGEFYQDTPKPDLATPIAVTAQSPVDNLVLGLARRSPADFDGDGDVDFADVILFLQRMMARSSGEDAHFDLDGNGRVDFEDFLAVIRLMRGAGKVASESGALAWQSLDGEPDEVLAGLETEAMPASLGYVIRVAYNPEEARFLGAERAEVGLLGDATFLAFEEEGVIVISEGIEAGEGTGGDGALAHLRFRPQGEATGVTLEIDVGMALTPEGRFVPLRLPEAQRLEVPPRAFRLQQNVPNPFNPVTAIAFELPEEVHVQLEVYNLVGQRLRTLVGEVRPAGRYDVSWDGQDDMGRNVSSGIYFYRLTAGQFRATRRMMLLR